MSSTTLHASTFPQQYTELRDVLAKLERTLTPNVILLYRLFQIVSPVGSP